VKKMPNIKSAIKRVKTTKKANVANAQAKSAMRTAVKKAEQAIASGAENAQELVIQATRALDKGVSKGIIHKNAASRKKSRLAKKLAQAN
jgi:small subunit ribosomal protein S20